MAEIDWAALKHDTFGAMTYTCPECGQVIHPNWKDELCRVRVARALDDARAQGDIEGAGRVAKKGIDRWVAANERIAELTADSRSYVPQEIAAELLDALDRAGMGKGDHGNTLHGMTMEAIEALDAANAAGFRAGVEAAARETERRMMIFGCSDDRHIELERAARSIRTLTPETK